MRKILNNPDTFNYNIYKKRVQETIDKAKGIVDEKYIYQVVKGMVKMEEVINTLFEQKEKKKYHVILGDATPLLNAFKFLSYAWMHLWSLTLCIPKAKELIGDKKGPELNKFLKDNQEAAYYYGKVLSSQFYISAEFQKFFGKTYYILEGDESIVDAANEIFTGAPEQ